MLIVNADDWGHTRKVTDAILRGFDRGLVSSTTAMVWMRDTNRSAEIARERRLPVGLHLNLTAPFEHAAVPQRVRERQRRLTERFTPDSWQSPAAFTGDAVDVRDAVDDQLEAFREAFGEPTHIDGHHHIHVHEAVLEALPDGMPMRSLPRAPAQAGAKPTDRERALRRRHPVPDLTVEFHRLHPVLREHAGRVVSAGRGGTLEIVAHPIADEELLGSDAWRTAIAGLTLGSFRDLGAAVAARASRPAESTPSAAEAAEARSCPICGSCERTDYHDRPRAVCASCGSLERQRALGRVLADLDPGTPAPRCLEIGPRNKLVFGDWLRARGWRYEASDKWEMRGRSDPDALGTYIDHDADLSDLHFARSAAYDLFLLQHVLAEVRDFRSALDEISRILRPRGTAFLEIPWSPERPASTMQPPDVYENIWAFGADLLDELRARFAHVEVLYLQEDRYAGDFFVCRQ